MGKFITNISLALLMPCLLAGCAASSSPARSASAGSAQTSAISAAFRTPQVMRGAGLDSVIGERAAALTQRFGEARIDLAEGDARKLQYISERCVLDIYLYPLQSNADPVATHVEARSRQGGAETDRAGCIAEVEVSAKAR